MVQEDSNSHQAWLRKRKQTAIAFVIQNLLIGCDFSIMFVNLWVYIQELVKPDHPEIYYSAIAVAYIFSSAVFSMFICKIADQYRCTRKIFFVTNIAVIVGNLLYMVPASPWFLLLGRLIAGIGLSQRSIITGEVARCYRYEELTSKFSLMGLSFSVGFLLGPMANYVFLSVDFWLGSWHITFANISGFYMAVLFTIAIIQCHFLVHDLSKQYDLKSESDNNKIGDAESDIKCLSKSSTACDHKSSDQATDGYATNCYTTNGHDASESSPLLQSDKEKELLWFIKQMIKNYDTCLLLWVSFVENFLILSADMCIPIIVIDDLKWPVSALNAILLGEAVTSLFPCFILIWKTFTDIQVFYMAVVGIFAYSLIQFCQIVLVVYNGNFIANLVVSVVYCLLFSNVMVIKDVFLGGFLAKMISSKYQSRGDSVRLTVCRVGSLTAFLSAPFALKRIDIIGWIYIGIILFLGILLFARRKTLGDPKIIIH